MSEPTHPAEASPLPTGQACETGRERIGLSLWDLVALVAARKGLFSASLMAGGAFAFLVSLLLPNTFVATAIILPPQKEQSAASALLGQLGPLAASAGTDMGLKRPSDLYLGLLGSRTIADHLIDRFRLRELYRTKTAAATRDALRSRSRFSAARDSLIRIEVEETDPELAAALANGYGAELNTLNKSLAMTDAGQRRVFLEGQMRAEQVALSQAEGALKNAQLQTGIIQLDGQATAVIRSVADLKAQIAMSEVEFQRLKLGATDQNPDVVRAQAELSGLRAQLRKLSGTSQTGDPFAATSKLPETGLEYVRRLREVKYHEFLLELLEKQYDAARLDESKAAPDLQVVDWAVPPDRRSGPYRALITLLGCIAGSLGAVLIACRQMSPGARRAPSL